VAVSVVAAPPGLVSADQKFPSKPPKGGNGCDLEDLFLTKHSAPGAEVGFSERLLLGCEVPWPGKAYRGKAARWPEGGSVVAAPHPDISPYINSYFFKSSGLNIPLFRNQPYPYFFRNLIILHKKWKTSI